MRDEHDFQPIESELSIAGERPSDNLARPLGAKRWLAVGASGVVMAVVLALAVGAAGDGDELAGGSAAPASVAIAAPEAEETSLAPVPRLSTLVAVAPTPSPAAPMRAAATEAPSTPDVALARTVGPRPAATNSSRPSSPPKARREDSSAPKLSPLKGLPLPEDPTTIDADDSRADEAPISLGAGEREATAEESLVAAPALQEGEDALEPGAPATDPEAAEPAEAPREHPAAAEAPV